MSVRQMDSLRYLGSIGMAVLAGPMLLVSSFGQASSEKANPTQTIVSNVDEVSVDLVVRDKKDRPVLDLKPGDIAVTDNGSPVKIASLRLVNSNSHSEHRLTLLFDRLDTAGARNARDIAAKIIKMVPDEGFSFCVMKTEGRLELFQEFTGDRGTLKSAVALASESGKPGQPNGSELPEKRLIAIAQTGTDEKGGSASAKERASAQVLLAALQESQRVVQDQHTRASLAGLLALSRTERTLPGRKTVLFFAQGLQADSSTAEMLRSIIGAANRAGVSIYAIDVNALTDEANHGLMAMTAIGGAMTARTLAPPSPQFSGSGTNLTPLPQPPPGLPKMADEQYTRYVTAAPGSPKVPLAELAEGTGGSYVGAGDSLNKPLRRMIEDMTTYYEASYASPVENYDGKFRPIAVNPVRGGLKIQSRAGYFAMPPNSGSALRPFEAPLMKILGETQLPSDVKFHARVVRLGDLPEGSENSLVVEIPMAELETRDDPNTNLYSSHVAVSVQIKNKEGAIIEHFGEDIPRHGTLEAKERGKSESVTMQRHFLAEPGQYILEAAVLDNFSGKAGAQRTEFEIQKRAPGPSLSDVTMVERLDPYPEEVDASEPLRYGNGRIVPGLSGRVAPGAKDISFFFLLHPDAELKDQPRLEMEVLHSNESIALVPLQLRKTSGPSTIPYLASIQSSALPGGDYEVIERLVQGEKTAESRLAFRIEGGELAKATGPANAIGTPTPVDKSEVTDSQLPSPSADSHNARRLVITSLPAGAVPAPSPEQAQTIVADARKRALEYGKSLPNFLCVEVTSRSINAGGKGNWKQRDSIAELLRYRDEQESRTTLEVNGKKSSITRGEMNSTWPLSVGEFGGMLNEVFQESSKADFQWKEAATLDNGTVQVFSYRVAKENATLSLSDGNHRIGVGFHGLVYIDSATSGVRRITLEADDLPRNFSMHAAEMTVDYGFSAIGTRDCLLPQRATVSVTRGHNDVELNEIAFRSYRRYAAQSRIVVN